MSPEIPQCCPRCGSNDKELYLPKCQDEYWTGDAHPWHTAPVPAPRVSDKHMDGTCDCGKPTAAPTGTPQVQPSSSISHPGERLESSCNTRPYQGAPTPRAERGDDLPELCESCAKGDHKMHGVITSSSGTRLESCYLCSCAAPTRTGEGSEREQFEAWRLTQGWDSTETQWLCWQASRAALRSQLAEAQKYNAHFCAAIGPMDEFDTYEDVIQRIKKMQQDLATAQARIARLEKALRPFALMARFASGGESHVTCSVRWDDLERAERALAEPQSGEK